MARLFDFEACAHSLVSSCLFLMHGLRIRSPALEQASLHVGPCDSGLKHWSLAAGVWQLAISLSVSDPGPVPTLAASFPEDEVRMMARLL